MKARQTAFLLMAALAVVIVGLNMGPRLIYTGYNMFHAQTLDTGLTCERDGSWALAGFRGEIPPTPEKTAADGTPSDVYLARSADVACGLDFMVRQGQPEVKKGVRTELRTHPVPFGAPLDYCFTVTLDTPWPDDDPPVTLAQWHAVPDRPLGEPGRSPPLRLMVDAGQLVVEFGSDPRLLTRAADELDLRGWTRVDVVPAAWGEPVSYCFGVTWERGGAGALRLERDGKVVALHRGAFGYNDLVAPFFKFGVYVPGADRAPGQVWRARFEDVSMRPSARQASDGS